MGFMGVCAPFCQKVGPSICVPHLLVKPCTCESFASYNKIRSSVNKREYGFNIRYCFHQRRMPLQNAHIQHKGLDVSTSPQSISMPLYILPSLDRRSLLERHTMARLTARSPPFHSEDLSILTKHSSPILWDLFYSNVLEQQQ
jgi:hypothetical protein